MGMEWDPDGDAERKRDSRKRWLLTLAVLGALVMIGHKLVSQYMRERERQRQLDAIMERQRTFDEMRGYAPTYR